MRKCAIVTGGTRGIGFAIAKLLAAEGCNVVITGRNETTDILSLFSQGGGEVLYVQSDVSVHADREKLLAKTLERFGRVDILINNAGVAPKERKDILEISEENFDFVMDVNLKGAFFLSQMAAKQMIKQNNLHTMPNSNLSQEDLRTTSHSTPISIQQLNHPSRIIFISSISSYVSSTNRGEYCISKAALSMVRALFADRLAEENIRVFEIRPGIIQTDMTAVVSEKYDKLIAEGLSPIKRWGQPEDVAGVAALLCRGEFDFCTGDIINVDGGFHIRRL